MAQSTLPQWPNDAVNNSTMSEWTCYTPQHGYPTKITITKLLSRSCNIRNFTPWNDSVKPHDESRSATEQRYTKQPWNNITHHRTILPRNIKHMEQRNNSTQNNQGRAPRTHLLIPENNSTRYWQFLPLQSKNSILMTWNNYSASNRIPKFPAMTSLAPITG